MIFIGTLPGRKPGMRTLRAIFFRRSSTCFSISAVGTDIDTRRSRLPSVSTLDDISFSVLWCEGRDSNPHALRRQILSLVRLPIPPPSLKKTTYYTCLLYTSDAADERSSVDL